MALHSSRMMARAGLPTSSQLSSWRARDVANRERSFARGTCAKKGASVFSRMSILSDIGGLLCIRERFKLVGKLSKSVRLFIGPNVHGESEVVFRMLGEKLDPMVPHILSF